MTMRRLMTTVAVAALATLPWAAAARAEGPEGHPHGHGPGFGPRFAEELGLTDDQKAQMEAIHNKTMEAARPLMESAHQAREAFQQALEADNADPATVGRAAIAMHAAEKKLHAAHEAAMDQFKALLTPEKRQKLDQMKERRPGQGPRDDRP